ncbi:tRNA epoxyqueuosine(34) reductase QueG [Parvibaculum sp.]|uniref:tRNA epoxyqueuosine(34) reductase QueG n=1 Tax=Parvibaculum sp. TaxID=2024848 RepID=UPI00391D3ED0
MPISTSEIGTKNEALREALAARAKEAGFDDIGIARADARPDLPEKLNHWLALGRHGQMGWMEETAPRRADPLALWPEAKSVIMLAMNYGPESDPLDLLERRDRAAISVYARNRDYHDFVKKRLKQVARWLAEESGAEVKVFVDTAPVMEKPFAEAAGLGWQGKHTNLVSRKLGSWFFLGAIFTTHSFDADERHDDRCGECRRCLDICPTEAFPAPYELDARRCISYLTIEHKGHIPREFRKPMGNRIYGCDDCLAVCPWNKFASRAREDAFHSREELEAPLLEELAALDDAGFRYFFSGSPIKRIGRDRFLRNVAIAIGNSGEAGLRDVAWRLAGDLSPLVRAAAIWALGELGTADELRESAAAAIEREAVEDVREEWRYLLR